MTIYGSIGVTEARGIARVTSTFGHRHEAVLGRQDCQVLTSRGPRAIISISRSSTHILITFDGNHEPGQYHPGWDGKSVAAESEPSAMSTVYGSRRCEWIHGARRPQTIVLRGVGDTLPRIVSVAQVVNRRRARVTLKEIRPHSRG